MIREFLVKMWENVHWGGKFMSSNSFNGTHYNALTLRGSAPKHVRNGSAPAQLTVRHLELLQSRGDDWLAGSLFLA